jgi:hypothetical protein
MKINKKKFIIDLLLLVGVIVVAKLTGHTEGLSIMGMPLVTAAGLTFGHAGTGGTASSQAVSSISQAHTGATELYTASAGETIVSFSVYGKVTTTPNGSTGMSAYTVSGGKPNTRLAAGTTITMNSTTTQWWTSGAVSQAMSGGVTYTVAHGGVAGHDLTFYYDAATGRSYDTNDLAATWTDVVSSNFRWHMYATYTAAASGPANLKSRSGNLKANIKSLSGNLIANCKSLSGNS